MRYDLLEQLEQADTIEEILIPQDLKSLLETATRVNHYIGFEISGRLHLGSGIITMHVIKNLQELGVNTTIFLADWHSWINKKLGGNINFIRRVALEYVKEVFIAAAKVVGADASRVKFVLGNDLYEEHPEHWATFMEVGMHTTLARIRRSISIMGRKEGDSVNFAQLCYPPLQVADIFTLQAHIAHAGLDQRKAHVIARQVALDITVNPLLDDNGNKLKPIAIHHKLVPSLLPPPKWPITEQEAKQLIRSGDMKMSKSKPMGAIFILDEPDEIRKKVLKAFAPEGDLTYNPVAIWTKMFVFDMGHVLFIKRPAKWGGDLEINSWEEFVDIYTQKGVHPQDVKQALAEHLIEMLRPAREYIGLRQDQIKRIEQEIQQRITR